MKKLLKSPKIYYSMKLSNEQLIKKARAIAQVHKLPNAGKTGEVGCALVSEKGNVYLGVSIGADCGIGFCAEHSAIASMVLKKEYRIRKIVAVSSDGRILPPCGRCRELLYQIDEKNYATEIIIDTKRVVRLKDLLPELWQKRFY